MTSNSLDRGRRTWWLIGILLLLALTWIFFRHHIERSLGIRLFLNSDAPREEAFEDLVGRSANPVDFLDRCWATGKITHRRLVAQFLKSCAFSNPPWFSGAEPLVFAGATDADMSVRELALATLEIRRSPRLFEYAQVQLNDADPLVRRMGLDYVRKAGPKKAVPVVVPLLDDPDSRLAAAAEVALMRWSGEDYGVRERLAITPVEGAHAGRIDPADAELIRQGIARRKQWWLLHTNDYAVATPNPSATQVGDAARPPLPDFTLHDLDGKRVRLSDFRGKVVLINFWATWCTACLAEIPDLVALRKELGNNVVILGIALDGVPDEHGHDPGAEGENDSHVHEAAASAAREKVARAVKSRGINYPVLLDASGIVGGEFDGGELPTTAIIDGQGCLRRRFIGERNLAVFEKMIHDASSN